MKIRLKDNYGAVLKTGDVVDAIENPKSMLWPRYVAFDDTGCYNLIDETQAETIFEFVPPPAPPKINVEQEKTINHFFNQELSELTVRFK